MSRNPICLQSTIPHRQSASPACGSLCGSTKSSAQCAPIRYVSRRCCHYTFRERFPSEDVLMLCGIPASTTHHRAIVSDVNAVHLSCIIAITPPPRMMIPRIVGEIRKTSLCNTYIISRLFCNVQVVKSIIIPATMGARKNVALADTDSLSRFELPAMDSLGAAVARKAAGPAPPYTRIPKRRIPAGMKRRAPYYYVVHAWSRPFMEMVDMLEAHFAGWVGCCSV